MVLDNPSFWYQVEEEKNYTDNHLNPSSFWVWTSWSISLISYNHTYILIQLLTNVVNMNTCLKFSTASIMGILKQHSSRGVSNSEASMCRKRVSFLPRKLISEILQ